MNIQISWWPGLKTFETYITREPPSRYLSSGISPISQVYFDSHEFMNSILIFTCSFSFVISRLTIAASIISFTDKILRDASILILRFHINMYISS
jgi:hypothetical protein